MRSTRTRFPWLLQGATKSQKWRRVEGQGWAKGVGKLNTAEMSISTRMRTGQSNRPTDQIKVFPEDVLDADEQSNIGLAGGKQAR